MVISSDVAGTGGRVMRAAFRRTVAWRWLVERRLVGPGGVQKTNLTPSMESGVHDGNRNSSYVTVLGNGSLPERCRAGTTLDCQMQTRRRSRSSLQ
jgi:hypothetical protein